MARGELFQTEVVTAETDKFRITQFCVLFARVSCTNTLCFVFGHEVYSTEAIGPHVSKDVISSVMRFYSQNATSLDTSKLA